MCYELAPTSHHRDFGHCLHELTAFTLLQHYKNRPGTLSTESLVHSCCVPCHHIGTLLAINIPCHTIILANTAHTLCPACNILRYPPSFQDEGMLLAAQFLRCARCVAGI